MRSIVLLCALSLLSACSLIPRVHRVAVQQGNVITQEMIDKLKPGMSREQVAFVMGGPVTTNIFNSKRWDYVYTILVPERFEQSIIVSLYFENEMLAYFTGDMAPTSALPEPEPEDEVATSD